MDNFFSSPDLLWEMWLYRKGMPKDLKPKTMRLKHGDIRVRIRGDMTVMVWRDKTDMCLLEKHSQFSQSHDEHRNAIKLANCGGL
jgi:hypothetical protein